jgi:hypothetical protein
VNVENADHLARVRRVFHAANEYRMAIVVHMHANVDHHRPYGTREAKIFLEQLLPEAPDVVVQIAHLAGSGGYADPETDAALFCVCESSRKAHSSDRDQPSALWERRRDRQQLAEGRATAMA